MEKTNAKTMTSEKCVVWAIDPFEKETRPDPALVAKLMNWTRLSGFKLQPVHILTVSRETTEDYLLGGGLSNYLEATKKASEQYLRDIGVSCALPVKVLVTGSSSRKEAIEVLLQCVESQKSPCVIVSSHGRSHVQRLVLGSFSESLLLQSKQPVLFLTHPAKSPGTSKADTHRVIFATDFSSRSRAAYHQFLAEAKLLQFDVTLVHLVALPPIIMTGGYGVATIIPERYFPDQMKWANEEGGRWKHLAQSLGVTVNVVVSEELTSSQTAESILRVARHEGADLIAMASSSGAFTSLVMGSVARDVFRANQYPVWIYGPKTLETKKPQSEAHERAAV